MPLPGPQLRPVQPRTRTRTRTRTRARTRTRLQPSRTAGTGSSRISSTSGPPVRQQTPARIVLLTDEHDTLSDAQPRQWYCRSGRPVPP